MMSVLRPVRICLFLLAVALTLSAGDETGKELRFFGRIVAVHASTGTATVKHGKIPGFMEAMTMDYRILPESALSKLRPGDDIRATARPGETTLYKVVIVSHAPKK